MRIQIVILLFINISNVCAQDSLFSIAHDQFEAADYQKAYASFKASGIWYQQKNQYESYAECNLNMGLCFVRMAAYQSGIDLANNTIEYVREVIPKNNFLIAEGNRIIGESYLNLGRNDEALEKLKLAESLYPIDAEAEIAECYNLLGLIYGNNGNNDLALQYHQQSLTIRKRKYGENSLEVANSNNNIGVIYLGISSFELATTYFSLALDVYKSVYGANHPRVAFGMINLARVKSEEGKHFDAISLITQVQQIWNTILPEDHPNKAYTYSIYGLILENNDNLTEALHQQEIALKMYVKLYGQKHPEVAVTHYRIGQVYQKKNEFLKAIEANQQAIYANLPNQDYNTLYELKSVENYLNGDYLLTALLAKAKALEAYHFEHTLKANDLKAAIHTYSIADTLVNKIRQLRLNENDKIRLGNVSRLIYENGIKLSLVLADQPFSSKKHIEKAFDFCERSKSSVLLSAIQETKAKSFSGIPPDVLLLEDSLKNEITFYQEKISSGNAISENQNKLFTFQKAYQILIEKLEYEYPKYYELKYKSQTSTINDIQNGLSPGTALLQYFEGENELYIFIITREEIKIEVKLKESNTRKYLIGYRNGLKYKLNTTEYAKGLYRYLIPNISTYIKQLILVPDSYLNTIPFEALVNPKTNEYLLQEYSISYDFSAALMVQRRAQKLNSNNKALLVAPYSFSTKGMKLPDLPGSKNEINSINSLLVANQCETTRSTSGQATEDFIKNSELTTYNYIHFATHGLVNESKPELSRIFLNAGPQEDGSLYAGDIYNFSINAVLVALSACETGLGKIEKGEGILGLSRALLFAGAQNLLVSQWQVSDASTSQLMVDFYRYHLLNENANPFHVSLQQAKLNLLNSDNYSNPYYWAPFILIGQ